MRKNRNSKMWLYLDASGVLKKGTDEEIREVKKAYRKKYLLEYKQKQRQTKPEFIVNLSKKNGEFETIEAAAKKHNMTITSFLQSSALAYTRQVYIVPNKAQVAMLEQLLSDCLNDIKALANKKERFFFAREEKIDAIERRIIKLESQINEVFRNPPLANDRQNKIA